MKTAAIITLGCRLNQADTALLSGRLARMGIQTVPYTPQGADVIVINSCAVTAAAARKSRQTLRAFRRRHPDSLIVLTGCAAETDAEGLSDSADLILSNEMKKDLEHLLSEKLQWKTDALPGVTEGLEFRENVLSDFHEKSRANLKIQEGCDNFCAYCIVPYTRGRERSRDLSETLDDFKRLVDAGYQEIAVTGINICTYSHQGMRLPELLEKLLSVPGNFRLRLGSAEPGEVLSRVIDVIAGADGRICEFLHPSIQHGSDAVLKRMNRHYLTDFYADFVRDARKKIPHLHLGTDVIVGFPGETDEYFEESFRFLESMKFANMHIFPFSPRRGTKAEHMKPLCSGEEMEFRLGKLHEMAKKSSSEYKKSLIGTEQTVIPEESTDSFSEGWTGTYVRTRISTPRLPAGKLVKVKIVSSDGEFLHADLIP